MKKRRQPISPWSLGSIPVTEVPNTSGFEDSKSLLKRLQQEDVQAEEARKRQEYLATPQGKAEAEFNATQAEFRRTASNVEKRVKEVWSHGIAEINELQWSQLPVDPIGDYATETDRDTDADRVVFDEFYHFLTARSITLTDDAWLKFFKFVACLARERNIKISKHTLFAILQRMIWELQLFTNGDVSGGEYLRPAPLVQPESEPEETYLQKRQRIDSAFDEIPDTREGRKVALGIIGKMFSYDVAGIYEKWADSMREKWNVDVVKPKITEFAGNFFMRNNLNPLSPKNYDLLRRVLSKQGLLGPLDYRTKEEKLSDALEESNLDSRDVRQAFERHTREILEAGPGRKGGIVL